MSSNSLSTKLLSFLNSGLGLWFLSSIVVGGLTFGYGLASSAWSTYEKRTERIRNLAVEIRTRTAQFEGIALNATDLKDDVQFRVGLLNLLQPPSTNTDKSTAVYAAFLEHKDRPLVSLIIELLILTPKSEHEEIGKAFTWSVATTPHHILKETTEKLGQDYKAAFDSPYWDRVIDIQ